MSLRTTYSNASWRGWSLEGSTNTTLPYNFTQKIDYDDPAARGLDCSMTGDVFILGNRVFTRSGNTWSVKQLIPVAQPSVGISADGNIIILGDPTDADLGTNAGAAYMYIRTTPGGDWAFVQKFYGSDTSAGDEFGSEVFISNDGNTIVVNAPFDDTTGSNAGAVYTFTRSGNTVSQQSALYSRRLRAMNGIATVGLFTPSTSDTTRYLYRRTTGAWSLSTAPSENGPNVFAFNQDGNSYAGGWSTADTNGLTNNGLVYYNEYNGTSWSSAVTLQPTQKLNNQGFGYDLEFDDTGNTLIISASAAGGNPSTLAGLYVFTKNNSGNYIDNGRLVTPSGYFTYPVSGITISGDSKVIVINSYDPLSPANSGTYIFTKS